MSDQWMTYQQLAQLWEMSPLGAISIIDIVTMALLIGGAYAKVRSLEKAGAFARLSRD